MSDEQQSAKSGPAAPANQTPVARQTPSVRSEDTDQPKVAPTASWTIPSDAEFQGDRRQTLPEIDGYELLGELGRGGMGVVYRARSLKLQRLVAIKLIQPTQLNDSTRRARFQAEALSIARLAHPNIVQIYDLGEHGGAPFLVMELVEGSNLRQAIVPKSLTEKQAAELVATLADAVAHAHRRHVVHRDLKPENILLGTGGVPKVADFGLALLSDESLKISFGQQVIGTAGYAAPEQLLGGPARDMRSVDIYSLGSILYELLAGRTPLVSRTLQEMAHQAASCEPPLLGAFRPGVAIDLDTIVRKCLVREPERRYASATDLAEDLRRFARDEPIVTRRAGTFERLARWRRRRPVVAGLLASLFVAVTIGLASGIYLWRDATAQRDQAQRSLAAVDNLLSHIVFDVSDRLEQSPNTLKISRDLLANAIQQIQNLSDDVRLTPAAMSRLATAHDRMGYVQSRLGASSSARQSYDEFHRLSVKLSELAPGDLLAQKRLSRSWERLGELADSRQEHDVAIKHFRRSLDLIEASLRSDPEDNELLRQKFSCHAALGRVAAIEGDLDAARAHYETSLKIAEQLRSEHPDSWEALLDLAAAWERLGSLLQQTNASRAKENYLKCLAFRERALQSRAPDDPLNGQIAIIQFKIAETCQLQHDWTGARQWLDRARVLESELTARNPHHRNLKAGQAITLRELGATCARQNDFEIGRQYLTQAWELEEELNPTDSRGLEENLQRARILAAQRDLEALARNFSEAVAFGERVLTILEPMERNGDLTSRPGEVALLEVVRQGHAQDQVYATAMGPLDAVLATAEPMLSYLLTVRALTFARRGELPASLEAIETLKAGAPRDAVRYYNVACGYGVYAQALARRQDSQAGHYVDLALESLRGAIDAGFADGDQLSADASTPESELWLLRDRTEFQDLLRSLDSTSPPLTPDAE